MQLSTNNLRSISCCLGGPYFSTNLRATCRLARASLPCVHESLDSPDKVLLYAVETDNRALCELAISKGAADFWNMIELAILTKNVKLVLLGKQHLDSSKDYDLIKRMDYYESFSAAAARTGSLEMCQGIGAQFGASCYQFMLLWVYHSSLFNDLVEICDACNHERFGLPNDDQHMHPWTDIILSQITQIISNTGTAVTMSDLKKHCIACYDRMDLMLFDIWRMETQNGRRITIEELQELLDALSIADPIFRNIVPKPVRYSGIEALIKMEEYISSRPAGMERPEGEAFKYW